MGKVIAIQGFAPDSRDQILNEPESTELWIMNNGYRYLKNRKAAKWFQLHPVNWKADEGAPAGEYGREKGHVKRMAEYDGELFLQQPDSRIPNAKVYPYDEIVAYLNKHINRDAPYLTSTFSLMLGYALWWNSKQRGAKNKISQIKLFGINLSTAEEYFNQRASTEALIGFAMGQGIDVWIPSTSAIWRGRAYAREGAADAAQMFHERIEYWRREHENYRQLMVSASYLIRELESWVSTVQQDPQGNVIAYMTQRLKHLKQMANNLNTRLEGTAGSYREAQHAIASLGQMHIPQSEWTPLVLAQAPLGYDVQNDSGQQPDSPAVGTDAAAVAAGAD